MPGGSPRSLAAGPPVNDIPAVHLKSASPRKGRALRKHALRQVQLLRRPFGLPKNITVDEYRMSPVCYLSTYNYKVAACIGSSADTARAILTVLDTGAGPNLIRSDCVPKQILNNLKSAHEFINISSASRHRIQVMGIASLTVKIADHICTQPFLVVKNLNADALLGTTFIDSQVEQILPRKNVPY